MAATLSFSSGSSTTTKTGNIGSSISVYIRNRTSGNKYKIQASFNGHTEWVLGGASSYSTSTSASYTGYYKNWTYTQLLKSGSSYSTSVDITFTLYEYNSSNVEISHQSAIVATMSLNSTNPVIIDFSYVSSNTNNSTYIQSVSRVKVTAIVFSKTAITYGETTVGSTIYTSTNPTIETLSTNLYSVVFNSGAISTYGSIVVKCRVKDSYSSSGRYSDYCSNTISVLQYSIPSITAYGASRYRLQNGQLVKDDSGDYIKFYVTAIVSSTAGNTGFVVIRYKKNGTYTWENAIRVRSGFAGTFSIAQNSPRELVTAYNTDTGTALNSNYIELNSDYSWDVNIYVEDRFAERITTKVINLAVGLTTLDLLAGGKGVAVGKVAELSDTFDCGFKGKFRKNITVDGDDGQGGTLGSTINGGLTLGTPLGIGSGGTGASSFSSNGALVKYNSSSGGKLETITKTDAQDWLELGDMAYEDTPPAHSHDAGDITSGTLSAARGGTGRSLTSSTAAGAMYHTGTNTTWSLGTLPVACGGTGKNSWTASHVVTTNSSGNLTSVASLSLSGNNISGTLGIGKGGTGITLSSGSGNGALYHNSGGSVLSCDTLPLKCGGTGTTSYGSEKIIMTNTNGTAFTGISPDAFRAGALKIYSGTQNISVSEGTWHTHSGYIEPGNTCYSDYLSIIVCPAQDVQAYDLQYYAKRYSNRVGFDIYAKDKNGGSGTITFAWIAIEI